jgi:hypothetical protein
MRFPDVPLLLSTTPLMVAVVLLQVEVPAL